MSATDSEIKQLNELRHGLLSLHKAGAPVHKARPRWPGPDGAAGSRRAWGRSHPRPGCALEPAPEPVPEPAPQVVAEVARRPDRAPDRAQVAGHPGRGCRLEALAPSSGGDPGRGCPAADQLGLESGRSARSGNRRGSTLAQVVRRSLPPSSPAIDRRADQIPPESEPTPTATARGDPGRGCPAVVEERRRSAGGAPPQSAPAS